MRYASVHMVATMIRVAGFASRRKNFKQEENQNLEAGIILTNKNRAG